MANVKITELTAATALAGTDVLPIVDVGADATKKVSVSDLLRNLPDGTASAPALAFADDQNTGVLSPGDNSLAFATSGTQRLVIDSSGNCGIGTSSVAGKLHVFKGNGARNDYSTSADGLVIESSSDTGISIDPGAGNTANIYFPNTANHSIGQISHDLSTGELNLRAATFLRFSGSSNTERMRIDSSGRLLLGHSSSVGDDNNFQLVGSTADESSATFWRSSSDAGNPQLNFVKTRGSVASPSIVSSGDTLGRIRFYGWDGLDSDSRAAEIIAQVDGTPGGDDMPGRLVFMTTADGSRVVTERMRIDSSGNVGVGITPTAKFHVGGTIQSQTGSTVAQMFTDGGAAYFTSVGAYPMLFQTNGSERARIDSSGRLLIGATSARSKFFNNSSLYSGNLQVEGNTESTRIISLVHNTSNSSFPILVLGKSRGTSAGSHTVVQSGDGLGSLSFQGADGSELVEAASIQCLVDTTPGSNDMPGRLVFRTTADGASSPTERMRITSNGYMQMGDPATNGGWRVFIADNGTASQRGRMHFRAKAGQFGGNEMLQGFLGTSEQIRITVNGNITNANNSYGSLSDAKLKENIVDASSQWDDLKAIQVRNYNFIEGQTHTQIGVVAQEVETVSPGLVTESPDTDDDGNDLGTVTKSVNYSVLYMKAVKALQEAMDRIETLETKVAALEAQ